MRRLLQFLIFYGVIPFLGSIPMLAAHLFETELWLTPAGVSLMMVLIYYLFRKKIDWNGALQINGFVLIVLSLIFIEMMLAAKGNTEGPLMLYFNWAILPLCPVMLVPVLMGQAIIVFVTGFFAYLTGFLFSLVMIRERSKKLLSKKMLLQAAGVVLCVVFCTGISFYLYRNRPSVKYQGHGFDYMHGYSSTDFTDYTVYADPSRLVTLDHELSLRIEKEEDMPVMDGAEACYPVYAALAKAVYQNIGEIELKALGTDTDYHNGKIVSFTNTIYGFERMLLSDDEDEKYGNRVDLFFGARPSRDQMEMAKECGVELEITPIGREAFVFFVEADNPVEGLTSEELRQIYHGDLSNWKELGGENQEIIAFQRPKNSGSQTMMNYFMGDISLKEPDTYELVDAMGGVINRVAQYANEDGAIGYTFRYFLEELNQEKGVKMLAVDRIYPTLENIENGSYPLTVDLCLVTRKEDPNPYVEQMKEFILSKDGQEIIRKTGYGGLE